MQLLLPILFYKNSPKLARIMRFNTIINNLYIIYRFYEYFFKENNINTSYKAFLNSI